MADDLDFESFDKLDDLDWGDLEKDVKEGAKEGGPGAAPAPARAAGNEATISAGGAHIDINYLLDVGLQISVEVGRRLYYISDILSWDPGSIIELDRVIGEPLNLLINGKPVAKGEVVVANDKFALRITEILDPHDRMLMLQS
ncbi:MAG TPA: flagellar motor switch protein FliN [bacterium]|nr:flagellar motor switch protein FliN [bacterium]